MTTNLRLAFRCLVLIQKVLNSRSYLIFVKWLIWFNQDFLSLAITKVLNYDQKCKGGQGFYCDNNVLSDKKLYWKRIFYFQFILTVIGSSIHEKMFLPR